MTRKKVLGRLLVLELGDHKLDNEEQVEEKFIVDLADGREPCGVLAKLVFKRY